jgi:hypothetical protein
MDLPAASTTPSSTIITTLPPSPLASSTAAVPTLTPLPAATLASLDAFQKGVAFAAWSRGVYSLPDSKLVLNNQIVPLGANWISLSVRCYQETRFSIGIDCTSEAVPSDDELQSVVRIAHASGLRVMLVPGIDLLHDPGHWQGQINYGSDSVMWKEWFAEYTKFILHYASLAADAGVDQFAVGSELYDFTLGTGPATYSQAWRDVIARVREVFKGPLVYKANWGGEERIVQFWDALDYIGIDAYYPISYAPHPTVDQLVAGWQGPLAIIEQVAKKWGKPVLLAEVGYQSVEGAAATPWGADLSKPVDLQTQANAYEAVFRVFGGKSWWKGVFWWVWNPNIGQGGPLDKDFVPQDKPAEDVLRHYYGASPRPTPTAASSVKKRVLFDEAHNEFNSISLDRAKLVYPDHPDYYYFGMLVESLKDGYTFDSNASAPLTNALLSKYDVLMVSAPRVLFTPEELQAVNEFIQGGGGLVILGDCGLDAAINSLAAPYGITFVPQCLYDGTSAEFVIKNFVDHEITAIPRLEMNGGESLTVYGSAVALAFTEKTAWQDSNWNTTHDAGEPYGPFPVLAVNKIGSGRIVAVADNAFQDSYFSGRSNQLIMKSILQWVTEKH